MVQQDDILDRLLSGLELDTFEDLSTKSNETKSGGKALVLTFCYGRGKKLQDICVPRVPEIIQNVSPSIEEPDIRDILPTKKRSGRGRARFLSQPAESSYFQKPGLTRLPPKEIKLQHGLSTFKKPSNFPEVTDRLNFSDDDDEGLYEEFIPPLLPSQKGRTLPPFGIPPAKRDAYNVTNVNDFPTLGGCGEAMPFLTVEKPVRTGLPMRSTITDSKCEIEFKPMKERKSHRKKRNKEMSKTTTADIPSEGVKLAVEEVNKFEKGGNGCEQDSNRSTPPERQGCVRDGNSHKYREQDGNSRSYREQNDIGDSYREHDGKGSAYISQDGNDCNNSAQDDYARSYREQQYGNMQHIGLSVDCEINDMQPTNSNVESPVCSPFSPLVNSLWRLDGSGVIEIDGVPCKGSLSCLEEVVASFGIVVDSERKELSDGRGAVRFRYDSADSCVWAVSCLHDSDCIFPNSETILECFIVEDLEPVSFDE